MIIDVHNHVGADLMFYLHGDFPYAQHLVTMTGEGRALGVNRWVVFPFVVPIVFKIEALKRGEIVFDGTGLEKVPYAFENRRLLKEINELFPDEGKDCLPLVMLDPMREQAAQIAELRKLRGEYRFYGLKLQTTMIQSFIKTLGNEGRGFVELAAEWDIPFLIHSSVGDQDPWAQASDILDVAEKFPDVRFCLAHSCRYDKECLDRVNALPNTWFDCSAHCIHCDGAIADMPYIAERRRRFDTDYTNPARVIADLAAAYPTKFMWGSDSPFYSYVAMLGEKRLALISNYAKEVAALKANKPEVVERIANRNIRAWLKLKDEGILTGK
ncbi:MAG TPA: amidohydrolase family protein [Verrucomicrobiae bacterium]|jgi:predicted TIM-barrel fold metal-dependent hydrolase